MLQIMLFFMTTAATAEGPKAAYEWIWGMLLLLLLLLSFGVSVVYQCSI